MYQDIERREENMPRDIKAEYEWNKRHYTRYHLALTKEYDEKLKKIMKDYHLGFTEFIKMIIDKLYKE